MGIIEALVIGSIVISMLFIYLTQREKSHAKRRPRRGFRPTWSSGRKHHRRKSRIRIRR